MNYLCGLGMIAMILGGQTNMDNSMIHIKRLEYLKIFSPPDSFLDYRAQGIEKSKIDQQVVQVAVKDGKHTGHDLELYKVIFDKRLDVFHYIFYIKHHDDLFSVYTVGSKSQRIEYKFEFSPN